MDWRRFFMYFAQNCWQQEAEMKVRSQYVVENHKAELVLASAADLKRRGIHGQLSESRTVA